MALKWRVYYVNEIDGSLVTVDNTQSAPGDLPDTHVVWLNQLVEEDTDTDRLFGESNYLWIPSLELWTMADDRAVTHRDLKGTAYTLIYGIQPPTPIWRKLAAMAMTDEDFPNATGRGSYGYEQREIWNASVEREVERRLAELRE